MSVLIWPPSDATLDRIAAKLEPYEQHHPDAEIEIRRRNAVTVWIRVIDPAFGAVSRADRHDILWDLIESLDEDDLSQISLLLALTPRESNSSAGNLIFDEPVVSP